MFINSECAIGTQTHYPEKKSGRKTASLLLGTRSLNLAASLGFGVIEHSPGLTLPVWRLLCLGITLGLLSHRFIAQVLQQLMEQLAKGQFVAGKGGENQYSGQDALGRFCIDGTITAILTSFPRKTLELNILPAAKGSHWKTLPHKRASLSLSSIHFKDLLWGKEEEREEFPVGSHPAEGLGGGWRGWRGSSIIAIWGDHPHFRFLHMPTAVPMMAEPVLSLPSRHACSITNAFSLMAGWELLIPEELLPSRLALRILLPEMRRFAQMLGNVAAQPDGTAPGCLIWVAKMQMAQDGSHYTGLTYHTCCCHPSHKQQNAARTRAKRVRRGVVNARVKSKFGTSGSRTLTLSHSSDHPGFDPALAGLKLAKCDKLLLHRRVDLDKSVLSIKGRKKLTFGLRPVQLLRASGRWAGRAKCLSTKSETAQNFLESGHLLVFGKEDSAEGSSQLEEDLPMGSNGNGKPTRLQRELWVLPISPLEWPGHCGPQEKENIAVFWNVPFLERSLAGSSGKPENETLEPLN
ncbi:hypothetical protein L345_11355, partial [Ophiophagus hannah]